MSRNAQQNANIFSIDYISVTTSISRGKAIIILFSMCRYAQSCAFISVIELPRIPAYCPKSILSTELFRCLFPIEPYPHTIFYCPLSEVAFFLPQKYNCNHSHSLLPSANISHVKLLYLQSNWQLHLFCPGTLVCEAYL